MAEQCPECRAPSEQFTTDDKRGELICRHCGLVLRGSYHYVGGKQVIYPFGGLIMDSLQPPSDRKYYMDRAWRNAKGSEKTPGEKH